MAATWALVIMATSPLNMPACCLETTSAWGSIQIKALRQHTHYSVSYMYIQRLLPMRGMLMLHQVSFIFCFFSSLFFYIIIHLKTTVLETNIAVTYLNIVRTKLTTLFIERLGSSSCHFHIVLWYHRWCIVHKDMKSSWILATLLKALESKLSQWKILEI